MSSLHFYFSNVLLRGILVGGVRFGATDTLFDETLATQGVTTCGPKLSEAVIESVVGGI